MELFLKTSGCFVATASTFPLFSNSIANSIDKSSDSGFDFPQGVASADPQSDAVMFWTRVVEKNKKPDFIEVVLHISRDEEFKEVLLEKNVKASINDDYTVRIFVDGLESSHYYYYRFIAVDGTLSRTGRTRTAPAPDELVAVNVAVMSCQHYGTGFFTAYKRLIHDDHNAVSDRKIDFILHLGDFIYEAPGYGGIISIRDGSKVDMVNRDGTQRVIGRMPSGNKSANTIEDYRYLYQTYLSDPDIQAARSLYPFVCIWDDHEVLNDYWQSYHPSGPIQHLKVNGNRAWFEYVPAALTYAEAGPAGTNPARDFSNSDVEIAQATDFDDDYLGVEPNNLRAVNTTTVYRYLRWGKLVDFIVVDARSYRGPRGVTDELLGVDMVAYPDEPVPAEIVELLNAGKTANNNNPPDNIIFKGKSLPNSRKSSPVGSMLGSKQKQWLKSSLEKSAAKWKVICTSVPFTKFSFDLSFRKNEAIDNLLFTDGWDGYPIERRELINFIKDNRINNVVSLSGDRHAHFAATIKDNYRQTDSVDVIPEFTCTGVSAHCRMYVQGHAVNPAPDIASLVSFDGTEFGYDSRIMPALNAWLIHGAKSARKLADTGDATEATKLSNPAVNPHLLYADTDAYGYFISRLDSDRIETEFVVIDQPIQDYANSPPPVTRRIKMKVDAWMPGVSPKIEDIEVVGELPLLGLRESDLSKIR